MQNFLNIIRFCKLKYKITFIFAFFTRISLNQDRFIFTPNHTSNQISFTFNSVFQELSIVFYRNSTFMNRFTIHACISLQLYSYICICPYWTFFTTKRFSSRNMLVFLRHTLQIQYPNNLISLASGIFNHLEISYQRVCLPGWVYQYFSSNVPFESRYTMAPLFHLSERIF